ncbi:MAG: Uma2 family endonuclease [Gemmatimonadales bacterium]
MAMASPLLYTAEEVIAFPYDGRRYEVIRGELLVTPAPRMRHELIVARLMYALSAYLEREPVGTVLGSRGDIVFGTHTKVEPDVFVVPPQEMATLDWAQVRHLLLIVEVLSPSSRRFDRFTKRVEFQRQGIPLYWVVDAEGEQVEEWTPAEASPVIRRDRLSWAPATASAPFDLDLSWLFRKP